jgi:hypothetical protein
MVIADLSVRVERNFQIDLRSWDNVLVLDKELWWASPIVFGPRIPDFLARLVVLSKTMRLSLRESRKRGRAQCCLVGNPGNAGANMGHPYGAVETAAGNPRDYTGNRRRVAPGLCGGDRAQGVPSSPVAFGYYVHREAKSLSGMALPIAL